jgi:hypothetical protein
MKVMGEEPAQEAILSETSASAGEFNDLRDCFGFDQSSKAVKWLI